MRNNLCLVLGGGGFLGSHLVEALREAGFPTRIFCKPNSSPAFRGGDSHEVEIFTGDFVTGAGVAEALEGAAFVFHCIGTTVPANSVVDPVFDVETNVVPTIRLLGKCVQQGVRRILFPSSGGVLYGRASEPVSEESPTLPACSYGITKLANEKYLHLFRELHGLDYTVLRISNLYGERQTGKFNQGAVAIFLRNIREDRPVHLWGDGAIVRDFVYVRDVARAFLKAMEGPPGQIFNVGTGQGTALSELVRTIEQVTGRRARITQEPGRPFDLPYSVLDIQKVRRVLGWEPRTALPEGIRATWAWLNQKI